MFPAVSVARTVTLYTLSAPTSVGASKFGAELKVITTVAETIETVAESTPPTLLQVTDSFAARVPTEVWFSAALKDVVVTFGGVVSGSVQLGLSEEKVTEPTFVTVRAEAELSVNNPEAFVCNKSNFVLATAVVGTVGTVKFAVYREVPFTKWKLVIRPGN